MDMVPTRGNDAPVSQRSTPEQPQSIASVTQSHTAPIQPKKKMRRRKPFIALVILVVIIAILAVISFKVKDTDISSAINTSEYQAVFFTNGQVYFGKLSSINNAYFKLTTIFYLQSSATSSTTTSSSNPQDTSSDSNVQLIKLGSEIHGPEDEMVINKDQLLFFENLKPTGKVSQSITSYLKK
jgi:hypothetical protein